MRLRNSFAVMGALAGCATPHVMSPFGDVCGVNHMPAHNCYPRPQPHDGVDFGPASVGDEVIASAEGVVLNVIDDPDAGTEVILMHDQSPLDHDSRGSHYTTGYLHLRKALVHRGDRVTRGQVIGEVGLFRNSAGIPHVHWRLTRAGERLDPLTKTVGCYESGKAYSDAQLELTYPLPC